MKHHAEIPGFFVSSLAAIAAWQEQLEFWLRITATLVAIAAGIVSLLAALQARRRAAPAPKPADLPHDHDHL